MFKHGSSLEELVDLLKMRNVSLYHACQLKDLKTYVELKGIPSRALMDKSSLPFTPFESDDKDKLNNCWDKVFLNLADFGQFFHNGSNSTPTAYGPILIKIGPECLLESENIAICLRTAGYTGFNRIKESLNSLEDVHRLFKHSFEKNGGTKLSHTFLPEELEKSAFDNKDLQITSSPEVSCEVRNQIISFDLIRDIYVDPIKSEGLYLIDEVRALFPAIRNRVWRRKSNSKEVADRYDEIINAVRSGCRDLKDLGSVYKCSESTARWAVDCNPKYQFPRFSEYLASGTLSELTVEKKIRRVG